LLLLVAGALVVVLGLLELAEDASAGVVVVWVLLVVAGALAVTWLGLLVELDEGVSADLEVL
jgi:hypothetical protein